MWIFVIFAEFTFACFDPCWMVSGVKVGNMTYARASCTLHAVNSSGLVAITCIDDGVAESDAVHSVCLCRVQVWGLPPAGQWPLVMWPVGRAGAQAAGSPWVICLA
jgi:hypothetical protein